MEDGEEIDATLMQVRIPLLFLAKQVDLISKLSRAAVDPVPYFLVLDYEIVHTCIYSALWIKPKWDKT